MRIGTKRYGLMGKQVYLYRAIDKFGNLVDVRLSKTRDMEAAKAFFKKVLGTIGRPEKITTDKHEKLSQSHPNYPEQEGQASYQQVQK